VRPGGTVAFHEADWGAHICDPHCTRGAHPGSHGTYCRTTLSIHTSTQVPRRCGAGVPNIRVNPLIHMYPPGTCGGRSARFVETQRTTPGQKVIAEADSATWKDALIAAYREPETLVVSHLFFRLWVASQRKARDDSHSEPSYPLMSVRLTKLPVALRDRVSVSSVAAHAKSSTTNDPHTAVDDGAPQTGFGVVPDAQPRP